ncbi:MAG: ABC transporter ATP-binding protein [Prevotellaceae bacterium]|nr:ABC transporter ATP-binding protein [Prevotellaceae bacterium]MBF1075239.1 ABC transporter ATP-binding protein [Prevotellaceae bacterium]
MLSIRNIHKSFGALEVLKGIDTDIARGEMVSIVGASGAGKTTLLQVMGTLLRPDEGSITLADTDVTRLGDAALSRFRNQHIGFIFQFHQLLPEFTALENVMLPALIAGQSKRAAANRAAELLDFMGLTARAEHKPTELSGGEQQRVAAARALTNRPDIVFADEPTGSLDTHNRSELQALFFRLRRELNQTFVIVTHDEKFAAQTDRCIRLADGRVVD